MNKFWGWCKSFFVKVQPVVHNLEPVAAQIAVKIDPALKPTIDVAAAAYGVVKGALHQTP